MYQTVIYQRADGQMRPAIITSMSRAEHGTANLIVFADAQLDKGSAPWERLVNVIYGAEPGQWQLDDDAPMYQPELPFGDDGDADGEGANGPTANVPGVQRAAESEIDEEAASGHLPSL